MMSFKDFILETTAVAADGKIVVQVPAIALTIYKIGKDITLNGKRYRISKHGVVKVDRGMKYADLTLVPL